MNSAKQHREKGASKSNPAESEESQRLDQFDIGIRAYVVPKQESRRRNTASPSEWSLVFDTETTTDPSQNLRFGSYRIYQDRIEIEKGLFFNPEILKPGEQATLGRYAKRHGFELRTASEFIDNIFFGHGYDFRASIIGFNLPFDLSRLSRDHDTARVSEARGDLGMRGAFSFKLSQDWWRPRVRIKHQSQRLAFIRFTAPPDPNAARSELKRKKRRPVRRGFFIDLKTIGVALTSESHTLDSLAEFLGVTRKKKTSEHGKTLTDSYIDYAVRDVETSWECFCALSQRYEVHQLRGTQLHSIYSEASLGKAYLREMRIAPWQKMQPGFPPEVIGRIMSTYYGGRAEVHIRRQIMQVYYCDFRSMYPTVCTLMRLWDFVIAKGMECHDATIETRRLLRDVKLADLQKPEFWPKLRTIVQVQPDRDIFPVRAKYEGTQFNIGVNYLSSKFPLWYTLADCIASKLLTGKAPRIVKAYSFVPKRRQTTLRKISIMGNPDYLIDPATDDFYKRLIDLRAAIRAHGDDADPVKAAKFEAESQAIKILANATSYGIFVELNVEELATKKPLLRYGAKGAGVAVTSDKREKPGGYFHPLLGTLITGGARLMLAIAELLTKKEELDWAFCDTDSMAFANSADLPTTKFYTRAQRVCDWFVPLNPYEHKGPLLESEDENWRLEGNRITGKPSPLFCYAVSAKRYVLFNKDAHGRPILRKGLAHGLGHLYRPYEDDTPPKEFPVPVVPPGKLGVSRWQHDLWYRIAVAAMAGQDTNSNPAAHAAFNGPAASRYHATKPEILRWFKSYNAGLPFAEQVRPFNFLLSFQPRPVSGEVWDSGGTEDLKKRRRLSRTPTFPKPVAPYDSNSRKAALNCFDRMTGKPVPIEFLQPYSEALAQYHLHAEAKFLNGKRLDRGMTERRYLTIAASDIHYIGKETNELEEQLVFGADPEALPEYGTEVDAYPRLLRKVRHDLQGFKAEEVSQVSGVSARYVRSIRDEKREAKITTLRKLEIVIAKLRDEQVREQKLIQWGREYDKISRREFARRLGEDRRNLDKVLSGKREPTRQLLGKLKEYSNRQ